MTNFYKDALPRGHQLAEYTIEAVLGHGGFGVTYLAHDTQLGTQVAIRITSYNVCYTKLLRYYVEWRTAVYGICR